jgi:hypothetical protein
MPSSSAASRTALRALSRRPRRLRPDDLAALVLGAALERAGVPHDAVDEVIFGAANQAGEDNRNVAPAWPRRWPGCRTRSRLHRQPPVRQQPAGVASAAQQIRSARPTSSWRAGSSR